MKKLQKNEDGAALAVVIILLAVVSILTISTISASSFESKHGIIDENQTKAYYLARSAVEVVSKSIEKEINELNNKKTLLDTAIEVYNENIDNANDLTDYHNYTTALENYNNYLIYVKENVLPIESATTYEHIVDGIDNVSSVSVKAITDAYRLEASSTINGSSAKAILNMDITTSPIVYTLSKNTTVTELIVIEEITETIVPGNDPATFKDAFYSYGSLDVGNNVKLVEPGGKGAKGKYRGIKSGKDKVDKGEIIRDYSTEPPLEPKSLLPININEDIRYTSMTTLNNFPSTLTPADNGYYKVNPIPHDSKYEVDTSLGDVVIKLNRLEFVGKSEFKVIGDNNFYIYIEDNNLTDGGLVEGKNGISFKSNNYEPKTFIIIDQPVNDREISKNDIEFKNKFEMHGYIYAPYSGLEFKNSSNTYGSIVAGDIKIKNNFEVVFTQPSSGSYGNDGDGNQVITVITQKNEYTDVLETIDSTYPLNIIPVSISKSWMPK